MIFFFLLSVFLAAMTFLNVRVMIILVLPPFPGLLQLASLAVLWGIRCMLLITLTFIVEKWSILVLRLP